MSGYRFRDTLIQAPYEKAFNYIAEPKNLPAWTHAFEAAACDKARLRTANGSVDVDLEVKASRTHGTIDWIMTFPDRSIAVAYSRLTKLNDHASHYGFVLTPPPAPLEQLEGALEEQAAILEKELGQLRAQLSVNGHRTR